jgi:hypothetical protein
MIGRKRRAHKLRAAQGAILAAHGLHDQPSFQSRLWAMKNACDENQLEALYGLDNGATLAQGLHYLYGLQNETEALVELYLREGGRSTCEAALARLVSWCSLAAFIELQMAKLLEAHGVEVAA